MWRKALMFFVIYIWPLNLDHHIDLILLPSILFMLQPISWNRELANSLFLS
ncbi:hypothetical protein O6H91_Y452600 [Diphasiastrum complanatum]|nr:hypothetical protein O6H91_Y452600 [Diphasiastrum complanatum]